MWWGRAVSLVLPPPKIQQLGEIVYEDTNKALEMSTGSGD